MGNHFHAVVETPPPNLSVGMKWLLGVYTQAFNRRHAQVRAWSPRTLAWISARLHAGSASQLAASLAESA